MELLKIHLSQTNGLLLLTLPFTVCQLHPHVLKLNLLYLELNLLLFLTPLQKQVQCHPPPLHFHPPHLTHTFRFGLRVIREDLPLQQTKSPQCVLLHLPCFLLSLQCQTTEQFAVGQPFFFA